MNGALVTSAVDPAIGEAIDVYGRLSALRAAIAPDLNDAELQLFAMVAHRTGLDPFAREIHAVKRQGKVTFQTGIDGFRAKAEQSGEYDHQDEPVFGEWIEKPFPHPETATVTIYRWRGDRLVAQSATVRWDSYYPGDQQGFQWKRMPDVMLSKCAEAQAFRKLFPRRFSGVYEPAEMDQTDADTNAAEQARPVAPTARERVAERRTQIEASRTTSEPDPTPASASGTAGVEAPPPSAPATQSEADPSAQAGEAFTQPGASPVAYQAKCDAVSPYGGSGQCGMATGHTGLHKNRDKESWK